MCSTSYKLREKLPIQIIWERISRRMRALDGKGRVEREMEEKWMVVMGLYIISEGFFLCVNSYSSSWKGHWHHWRLYSMICLFHPADCEPSLWYDFVYRTAVCVLSFLCLCTLLPSVNADSSFWQSCRTLLELMVLDKHLIVRKMHQHSFDGGPSILQGLIGSKSSQSKLICREHYFANPMSTSLL